MPIPPLTPPRDTADPDKITREEFDMIDSIIRSLQLLALVKGVNQLAAPPSAEPVIVNGEVVADVSTPLELTGRDVGLLPESNSHPIAGQESPTLAQGANRSLPSTGELTVSQPSEIELGTVQKQAVRLELETPQLDGQNPLPLNSSGDLAVAENPSISIHVNGTEISGQLSDITREKLAQLSPENLQAVQSYLSGNVDTLNTTGAMGAVDTAYVMDAEEVVDVIDAGVVSVQIDDAPVTAEDIHAIKTYPVPRLETVSIGTAEQLVGQNPGDSFAQNPEILAETPTVVALQDPETGQLTPISTTASTIEGSAKETIAQAEAATNTQQSDIAGDRALEVAPPGGEVAWDDIQSDRALEAAVPTGIDQRDIPTVVQPTKQILASLPPGVDGQATFTGSELTLTGTPDAFQVHAPGRGQIFAIEGGAVLQNQLTPDDLGRFQAAQQMIQDSQAIGASDPGIDIPVPNIAPSAGPELD